MRLSRNDIFTIQSALSNLEDDLRKCAGFSHSGEHFSQKADSVAELREHISGLVGENCQIWEVKGTP
jgi:hypothetical protein